MPLIYERAFGGSDNSHENEKIQGTELRNPIGAGFHLNDAIATLQEKPLPNIEQFESGLQSWSDKPEPIGFGTLGRGWKPRIDTAGTYDKKWMDEKFPFLPDDFDEHYFQSAPLDQQHSYFTAGEFISCKNMTSNGRFDLEIPDINFPITYKFRDRDVKTKPNLDTVIIEPHNAKAILTWRIRIPVGRKINMLREIIVGGDVTNKPKLTATGKPHFNSLEEMINWRKGKIKL